MVALLPPVGSRSDGGGDRPWWVLEGKSVGTDGDGDWFVEVLWSQGGFRRGDRQRDLVSFVTGDRVISPTEMASDIRHLVLEEPHGFGGTPAADGRVWWDSRDEPDQDVDRPPDQAASQPDDHGEVVAVLIRPASASGSPLPPRDQSRPLRPPTRGSEP